MSSEAYTVHHFSDSYLITFAYHYNQEEQKKSVESKKNQTRKQIMCSNLPPVYSSAYSSNTFQLRCFFIKFIYMLSLSHFKLAQNLPRRNWRKIKFDALTCVCNPKETCAYCENMHKFKRKSRRHSFHGIIHHSHWQQFGFFQWLSFFLRRRR